MLEKRNNKRERPCCGIQIQLTNFTVWPRNESLEPTVEKKESTTALRGAELFESATCTPDYRIFF